MKKDGHVKQVEVIASAQTGAAEENPYLTLHRVTVRNTYKDGTTSPDYPYDAVLRQWLDAVVVVLPGEVDGRTCVCLRSSVRPPLLLRGRCHVPVPADPPAFLWELPAGLIEEGDVGEAGIRARAAAETMEEAGYRLAPEAFNFLGNAPFVSPGVIPERLWYTTATVPDATCREIPAGDGSPVEDGAVIEWVPLDRALALCDEGQVDDMKTELGIRRIAAKARRTD